MYCNNCGSDVPSGVNYCPNCGTRVRFSDSVTSDSNNTYSKGTSFSNQSKAAPKEEGMALGLCALIFSILGSCIGIVLAIIGLSTYKTKCTGKTLSVAALIIFIVECILMLLVFGLYFFIIFGKYA